jgi:iron complex transport system substrate-binding protein
MLAAYFKSNLHRERLRDRSLAPSYDGGAMRIISLTPSATEIVHALGLGDQLVGRTHACDFPAEVADVPIVTVSDPDAPERSIDGALLVKLEPDLVLTDGSEESPLVDYGEVSDVVGGMTRETTLVALAPHSVEGILNSISTVGAYTEAEYEAVGLMELLRQNLSAISVGFTPDTRRAVVLESLDPLLAAGRWVPEMVRRAGGWELLGREGESSGPVTWEQLREVEPQVLVLALHDADAAGAEATLKSATLPGWFDELQAVREGEFFAVNGKGLFARPGPRVVEGISVLAELFYPEIYAGAGPVEAWRPLAPIGLADQHFSDSPAGQP